MNRNIIYTDPAKEKLAQLHNKINKDIEEYFEDTKYVPGDDFIEITGSDIDRMAKKVQILRYNSNTSMTFKQFAFFLYFTVGSLSILSGIYYNDINNILKGDPVRIILIGGGCVMIILSFLYMYLIRVKSRRDIIEKEVQEMEQKMKESFSQKIYQIKDSE